MRFAATLGMLCVLTAADARAQSAEGPTDAKAQKSYAEAESWLKEHKSASALDSFRKADKQDGGHCKRASRRLSSWD